MRMRAVLWITAPLSPCASLAVRLLTPRGSVGGYVRTKAQAALKSAGGRFLAAGQNVTALEGEPPKTRVTIQVWESLEKMQAAYNSAEYKDARKIGEKYAKFRAFAVEGLPQ